MKPRLLILNADDFGYSHETNAAILKAHCEGALTSASLMVAEDGFSEAVRLAKETPSLGVGLHLAVTLDRPVLPPAAIPHIVTPTGKLDSDLFRAGLRYAFSAAAQRDLEREIEAQFARFAETGLPWSHVDGHQHFHLPPPVWDRMLRLCVQNGVLRLRYPNESIRAHRKQGGKPAPLDSFAALIFRALRRRNLEKLRQHEAETKKPFFLCHRVYGHLQTGDMEIGYVLRLLKRLEGETNEIYFHPGAPIARLLPPEAQKNGVRDVELHTLTHPALRQALQEANLQTVTYAEAERRTATFGTK